MQAHFPPIGAPKAALPASSLPAGSSRANRDAFPTELSFPWPVRGRASARCPGSFMTTHLSRAL